LFFSARPIKVLSTSEMVDGLDRLSGIAPEALFVGLVAISPLAFLEF
jgi:hypothetical protein